MKNLFDKLKFSYTQVTPIVFYKNAKDKKTNIMQDNVNKSGVYRWINNINGKTYIGSSVNITTRLYKYYSDKHLFEVKTPIYNAIHKYGHSNFSLEILEYCEDNVNILDREQYYFDLLKPEYNLLKEAGSSLGFKHSPETLELFSNRIVSDETRANLSKGALNRVLDEDTKIKISESRINKPLTPEVKSKISKALTKLKGMPIIINNLITKEITEYDSLTEAGKSIGVSRTAIRKYANSGKAIKDIYLIELK